MPLEPRPFSGEYPPELQKGNALFVSTGSWGSSHSHPELARDAIIYLARFAYQRDYRLVVRADPKSTLILLAEAARFKRDGELAVIVFDDGSQPVDRRLLAVGDWRHGILWHTSSGENVLRDAVLGIPTIRTAIFIGGDDASIEDYDELHQRSAAPLFYPIATTGGAATMLLDRGDPVGTDKDPDLKRVLREVVSYPLVMLSIFDDIESSLGMNAGRRQVVLR